MLLTKSVHDACLIEIVGGYLKFDEIARGKADEPLPHLSRDVGEYETFISKRDPKHGSGQHGDNLSFGFNRTLHWQFRCAVSALTIHPAKSPTDDPLRYYKNERAIDFVFIALKASETDTTICLIDYRTCLE